MVHTTPFSSCFSLVFFPLGLDHHFWGVKKNLPGERLTLQGEVWKSGLQEGQKDFSALLPTFGVRKRSQVKSTAFTLVRCEFLSFSGAGKRVRQNIHKTQVLTNPQYFISNCIFNRTPLDCSLRSKKGIQLELDTG